MTYYKKIGRRYIPVAETDIYSGYSEGTYLVTVKPGHKSISRLLDTSNLDLKALFHENMVEACHSINQSRLAGKSAYDTIEALLNSFHNGNNSKG